MIIPRSVRQRARIGKLVSGDQAPRKGDNVFSWKFRVMNETNIASHDWIRVRRGTEARIVRRILVAAGKR